MTSLIRTEGPGADDGFIIELSEKGYWADEAEENNSDL
jgi:hypothetical protein